MIDRYDAPEGYVAVRNGDRYACTGCAFKSVSSDCKRECDADERKDNQNIIFKTRADFEAMLRQELSQFYGVKKEDITIWVKHRDSHK